MTPFLLKAIVTVFFIVLSGLLLIRHRTARAEKEK